MPVIFPDIWHLRLIVAPEAVDAFAAAVRRVLGA